MNINATLLHVRVYTYMPGVIPRQCCCHLTVTYWYFLWKLCSDTGHFILSAGYRRQEVQRDDLTRCICYTVYALVRVWERVVIKGSPLWGRHNVPKTVPEANKVSKGTCMDYQHSCKFL